MQFYSVGDKAGSYWVRESWQEALHHVGSSQMRYLKELMESVDFINGVPDDKANDWGLVLSALYESTYH